MKVVLIAILMIVSAKASNLNWHESKPECAGMETIGDWEIYGETKGSRPIQYYYDTDKNNVSSAQIIRETTPGRLDGYYLKERNMWICTPCTTTEEEPLPQLEVNWYLIQTNTCGSGGSPFSGEGIHTDEKTVNRKNGCCIDTLYYRKCGEKQQVNSEGQCEDNPDYCPPNYGDLNLLGSMTQEQCGTYADDPFYYYITYLEEEGVTCCYSDEKGHKPKDDNDTDEPISCPDGQILKRNNFGFMQCMKKDDNQTSTPSGEDDDNNTDLPSSYDDDNNTDNGGGEDGGGEDGGGQGDNSDQNKTKNNDKNATSEFDTKEYSKGVEGWAKRLKDTVANYTMIHVPINAQGTGCRQELKKTFTILGKPYTIDMTDYFLEFADPDSMLKQIIYFIAVMNAIVFVFMIL